MILLDKFQDDAAPIPNALAAAIIKFVRTH